mmetsp:Transcript_19249/g.41946  ORF Transcript_19249/g.41946 Transcript_19249/m.41946 type:complete len:229 (-) Transcript_19249:160-846(-)
MSVVPAVLPSDGRVLPPRLRLSGNGCHGRRGPNLRRFTSSWALRVAVAATLGTAAFSGKPDQQYQTWAGKIFEAGDEKGLARGTAVACVFCQIIVTGVNKQVAINKDKPRDERFSEEDTEEVLLELCESASPSIAQSMNGFPKDAEMICKRVVREHVGDMIDAVSLGEDLEGFCKENKICPFEQGQLSQMVEVMAKFQEFEKERGEGTSEAPLKPSVEDDYDDSIEDL